MKLRYIIVDDAPFIRELIKNIVGSTGAVFVGEAANGREALQVAETTLPDLVFLDMVMPEMNGPETALQLKKMMPDVKIIGCSTLDNPAIVNKSLREGFDAYVTKPFTKQQILFEIENLFPQLREATNE